MHTIKQQHYKIIRSILYLIIIFILFVFMVKPTPIRASDSIFHMLDSYSIGDLIEDRVISMGVNEGVQEDGSIILKFQSTISYFPHRIIVKDNRLSYVELIIPPNEVELYQEWLRVMGQPETKQERINDIGKEILVGFPSQGIAYITNEKWEVIAIRRFEPTSIPIFISRNERGYSNSKTQDRAGILQDSASSNESISQSEKTASSMTYIDWLISTLHKAIADIIGLLFNR